MPPADVIERLVLGLPQVREGCARIASEVETEATQLAYERAFDVGTYAARIRTQLTAGPGALVRAEDEKSRWIEEGTGVYGPKRRVIRPKKGKVLVFKIGDETIFAKSVKGRPASHVLRDASQRVAARHGLRWRDLTGRE